MGHIRQITDADATGLLEKIYTEGRTRYGSVAGIIRIQGLDPPTLQGCMGAYMAVMKRPNALPAAQREMLATVVSNANDCFY